MLPRCGWEIPQFLDSSHADLLGSPGCLVQPAQHLHDGHFPDDSISCPVRFNQADKKVQCCILIVTLAGNTCGSNLSIICSTSHVSPEPCLPSCGKAEKVPVMMEELEGVRSQFSIFFFIYLCCPLGSIKCPGSWGIKVSIQLQVKGWPKSVVRPQGKKRGCCTEGSTQEGTAWWLTSQGSFGLRLGWQGGLIQHLSLRVSS